MWLAYRLLGVALFLALSLSLAGTTAASARDCEFVLGFKALHDSIPRSVGECVENVRYDEKGNAFQKTTGGMLAWRKADNFTAFTDGQRTWANVQYGILLVYSPLYLDW